MLRSQCILNYLSEIQPDRHRCRYPLEADLYTLRSSFNMQGLPLHVTASFATNAGMSKNSTQACEAPNKLRAWAISRFPPSNFQGSVS